MPATPVNAHPMTLRSFVQVTLRNFRLLLTTLTNPDAHSPMSTPDQNAVESAPVPAEPLPVRASLLGEDVMHSGEDAASVQAVATLPESDGQLQVQAGAARVPLSAVLESLLFVAEGPVEPAQLAQVLSLPAAAVVRALEELGQSYQAQGRGLRLQTRAGRYQLVSAPATASLIELFLNLDTTSRLSAPALETLAIIAYRQPVTRAQIEAVRGVDCSGLLRSLLQRGLVEETGRMDAPGRPVLYGVTDLFLRHFGLTGLHELPPLAQEETANLDEALE